MNAAPKVRARKGDFILVESATSYQSVYGPRKRFDTFTFGRVESVDRAGFVKTWRSKHDSVNKLLKDQNRWMLPADRIKTGELWAAVKPLAYFDSLEAAQGFARKFAK